MSSTPHTERISGPRSRASSLSVRYIALIVVIVVTTGVILGGSVTLIALGNAALERQQSLEYASSVVATSLLPVIADQDPQRIEAQLQGILELSSMHDIECIEIRDPSGVVIADTDDGCTCELVPPSRGPVDVFTLPQVTRVPVAIDGLHVATVWIQFRPVGLEQALVGPVTTTLIVLGLAMVVSSLWGGWMVLRTVVEPIGELRDAAGSIAMGERTVTYGVDRSDEIGELARTLRDMAAKLKAQEQELLNSYRSLESAYNDQADLAVRLERSMSLKSDFVAMASHEIRSPLAVIRLYAEMLDEEEFGEVDPQLSDAIEAIVDAVGRLSTIVAGLLDVALLERGLMALEYQDVDLTEVVERAVADARTAAHGTEDVVELAGPLPEMSLHGDPVRLRQVIDNLISNARKYSGGAAHVTVALHEEDGVAVLEVADTGVGIPPERANVLFELFGRVDTTDSAEVSGLGLGLPISDRIVKAHGGEITFVPNPQGRGTVFVVRLPIDVDASDQPDAISVV